MAEDLEGAPDYTKLVRILGRDEDGNLVTVRVDSFGRIILLPYGTQSVGGMVFGEDDVPDELVALAVDEEGRLIMIPYGVTTVGGTVGVTGSGQDKLVQLAVDEEGRLIMLPYGWDGAAYQKLKVDKEGRMVSVMKGQADVTWELNLWLKFVASEGTLCKDYSGWGNDAQGYSGVAEKIVYEDGVVGQSVLFDGTDDYLKGTVLACVTGPGTFTVEFWVYSTLADEGEKRIIFQNSHGGDDRNSICINGGTEPVLAFSYFDGADYYAASGPITLHAWHHVVCIDNLGTLTLWIDGILQTGTQSAHWGETVVSYFIGIDDNKTAQYFSGILDEFRVYARPLSSDEVAWRYANTNPVTGKPTRMVAVDNEGRMMVNIQDLPYKDTVSEHNSEVCAAGGAIIQTTSKVPMGKVWVLSVISAYIASGSSDAGCYVRKHDDVTVILHAVPSLAADTLIDFRKTVYLKAGEYIDVSWAGLTANAVINIDIAGYVLNAP